MRRGGRGRRRRQQESVEQLLRDDLEPRTELRGGSGSEEPFVDVALSCDIARKPQFAREQIHLDISELPAAVVDDPIHSDRRRRDRAVECDRRWLLVIRIVAEFDMTNRVRYEKGLLKR